MTMRAPWFAWLAAGAIVINQTFAGAPARADNPMGYRLMSTAEADGLPRNHGALGLDIGSAREITDDGMTFELIRVKQVRPGSAGAQAGFGIGDDIIAADGRVFPNLAAFAAYIGSKPPGSHIAVDYIPAGSGPDQAQRVTVAVGGAGSSLPVAPGPESAQAPSGMSTRMKLGLAAAALLGCYELGCFSKRTPVAQ